MGKLGAAAAAAAAAASSGSVYAQTPPLHAAPQHIQLHSPWHSFHGEMQSPESRIQNTAPSKMACVYSWHSMADAPSDLRPVWGIPGAHRPRQPRVCQFARRCQQPAQSRTPGLIPWPRPVVNGCQHMSISQRSTALKDILRNLACVDVEFDRPRHDRYPPCG